jgi:hypothetical protein
MLDRLDAQIDEWRDSAGSGVWRPLHSIGQPASASFQVQGSHEGCVGLAGEIDIEHARNATLWRVVTAPGRENQVELGSRQDHYADPHLTGVALVAGELPARRAGRISLARALDQG